MLLLRDCLPDTPYHQLCSKDQELPSDLTIRTRLVELRESLDAEFCKKEVDVRRQRLGADTLEVIRQKVDCESILASDLGELYERLLALIAPTGDAIPEHVSIHNKYIEFLVKKLRYVTADEKEGIYTTLISSSKKALELPNPSDIALLLLLADEDVPLGKHSPRLLQAMASSNSSNLLALGNAYIQWSEGGNNSVDSSQSSAIVFDADMESVYSHVAQHLLGRIKYDKNDYPSSLKHLQSAEAALKEYQVATGRTLPKVAASLALFTAQTCFRLGPKWYPEALRRFKLFLEQDSSSSEGLFGLGLVLEAMEKYEESARCFRKAAEIDPSNKSIVAELGWVLYKTGELEAGLKLLQGVLEKEVTSENLYRRGRILWDMDDGANRAPKGPCFADWLQSVKLNPQYGPAFAYLGLYYETVEADTERAEKCFARAISLDPGIELAVDHLSILFIQGGGHQIAKDLLLSFTEREPRVEWAWQRLGFISLAMKCFLEAAGYFQNALRIATRNPRCWEGLGVAYAEEGKYMAALKAYGRAVELQPESPQLYFQIAKIKQKLGLFGEAVEEYRLALKFMATEQDGQNDLAKHLPTTKGLCESLYYQARQAYDHGARGKSNGLLIEALELTSESLRLFQLHSLAKLLGDILLTLYRNLGKSSESSVSSVVNGLVETLHSQLPQNLRETLSNARNPILQCGAIAYKFALHLCAQSRTKGAIEALPGYWHDLACTYQAQRSYMKEKGNAQDERQLMMLAMACEKKAIALNPADDLFWQALGIISLSDSIAMSQHSLIKALQINPENPATWFYLGALYFLNKDPDLAQLVFSQVQAVDPEWALGWLGQALIAEQSGKDGVEICYRYANCLYKQSKNAASVLSSTADLSILSVVEREPQDWAAWNLLGLIAEAKRENQRAVDAYQKAFTLLQTSESPELNSSVSQAILQNLARASCAAHLPAEAIAFFEKIPTLSGSIFASVGYGMALFSKGDVAESLTAFERALELVNQSPPEDGSRLENEITLLLCKVLYKCGCDLGSTEYQALAKQQLLNCVSRDSNFVKALVTLCALGIVHKDSGLAQSAAAEILKVDPVSPELDSTNARQLLSTLWNLQGDKKRSASILAKAIRQKPWLASRWQSLSQWHQRYLPGPALLRLSDATLALQRSHSEAASPEAKMTVQLSTGLALLASPPATMHDKHNRRGRSAIQRAIFLNPGAGESWAALALYLRADLAVSGAESEALGSHPPTAATCGLILRVAETAATTKASEWTTLLLAEGLVTKGEVVAATGASDEAQELSATAVKQAMSLIDKSENSRLQAAIALVVGRASKLSGAFPDALASFKRAAMFGSQLALEELGALYSSFSLYTAAVAAYQRAALVGPSFTPLLRAARCTMEAPSLGLPTFDFLNDALRISPKSSAARFLQILAYIRSGDLGKGKKLLTNLDPGDSHVKYLSSLAP
ncbi:hypothetical protein DFS34DRAFT_574925 [Phlyctochytrium arcticum]|nr:hypothetical protein DFS34DRAFT_574925 [Phlyctochytrium arcticum]